ncbi:MAG: AbgT family transporter, partial [Mycoplasma sp.]|nr:AbgT family transporter [Mycoplasma sp.]
PKKIKHTNIGKISIGMRFARFIERAGNKLPSPFWLFWYFLGFLLVITFFLSVFRVDFAEGGLENRKFYPIVNVLSDKIFSKWFIKFFAAFTTSEVTWIVIVMMLGVRVAEKTGFFEVTILRFTKKVPSILIAPIYIMLCVTSSLATDVGYLLLIPLGGLIWKAIGKHPITGITTAFAGVSGGFGAALMIGPIDVMLFQFIGDIINPTDPGLAEHVKATPQANLYFIIGSTIVLTIVTTLVSNFIIDPMVNKLYPKAVQNVEGDQEFINKLNAPLNAAQKKGLYAALGVFIIFSFVVIFNMFVPGGLLTQPGAFLGSITLLFTLLFFFMGLAYGVSIKMFKNKTDVFKTFLEIVKEQGGFILVVISAFTFISLFTATGMATLISNLCSDLINAMGIQKQPLLLMIVFIVILAFLNLFSAGMTSKILMLGPIFFPLFLDLGIHPFIVAAAYRIGDSPTNIITPLLVYLPLIIGFCHKYLKKEAQEEFQIGSIISIMLPFALIMLVTWIILFAVWFAAGVPFGPLEYIVYDERSKWILSK